MANMRPRAFHFQEGALGFYKCTSMYLRPSPVVSIIVKVIEGLPDGFCIELSSHSYLQIQMMASHNHMLFLLVLSLLYSSPIQYWLSYRISHIQCHTSNEGESNDLFSPLYVNPSPNSFKESIWQRFTGSIEVIPKKPPLANWFTYLLPELDLR